MQALPIASAIVSTVSGITQSFYQGRVAKNNAAIAGQNAATAKLQAATNAQLQDFEAKADIGSIIAQSGASGLSGKVGSMAQRVTDAGKLAARDRQFTVYQGNVDAQNFLQQKEDFSAEASSARSAAMFDLIGGGIDIKSSMISSADTISPTARRRVSSPRPAANPNY